VPWRLSADEPFVPHGGYRRQSVSWSARPRSLTDLKVSVSLAVVCPQHVGWCRIHSIPQFPARSAHSANTPRTNQPCHHRAELGKGAGNQYLGLANPQFMPVASSASTYVSESSVSSRRAQIVRAGREHGGDTAVGVVTRMAARSSYHDPHRGTGEAGSRCAIAQRPLSPSWSP
jgi:hypothetical protein